MSSDEFQIIRISQRTKEINPRQNTSKIVQSKTSYQKVGSSRIPISTHSQPATTFVSRRELNQSSPVYTGGMNQLPVRSNVVATRQTHQEKKVYKYEPRQRQNQNQKQVSSVGKAQIPRYRSTEESKYQKRYETSGSPLNRRNAPMTFGTNYGNNFNIKKWAYASKQVTNKIIIIQRWWRLFLKNSIYRQGRFNRNYAKTSAIRSKSSMQPTCEFLKDFVKQGENITEKVYPGKNNKLVVETRKVEVFKNMNPNSKSQIKVKKTGENITEKTYQKRDNKLINERRKVEVFQVNKPQIPSDIKMFTTEKGEYALRIQKSKKYIDREKGKEKETIISDRRKVSDMKLREPRRREVQQTDRYGPRKEGEKITERIIPGKDDNLYLERRKVEVFKDLNYKDKTKYQISNQRRGQITSTQRFKEENGLTKELIKEKMIEIWLEESSKAKENSFSLYADYGQNRLSNYEIRNTSSSSRIVTTDKNKEDINSLLRQIKEKDNELNKIANQLKQEMTKNKTVSTTQRNQPMTTSKNTYSSSTTKVLNINNFALETKIQQLLTKLKEKDEQFNKLVNKIKTQSSNESEQKTISRLSGKQRDKSKYNIKMGR